MTQTIGVGTPAAGLTGPELDAIAGLLAESLADPVLVTVRLLRWAARRAPRRRWWVHGWLLIHRQPVQLDHGKVIGMRSVDVTNFGS